MVPLSDSVRQNVFYSAGHSYRDEAATHGTAASLVCKVCFLNVEPVAGGAIGKALHFSDTGEHPTRGSCQSVPSRLVSIGENEENMERMHEHASLAPSVVQETLRGSHGGKNANPIFARLRPCRFTPIFQYFTNHTRELLGYS